MTLFSVQTRVRYKQGGLAPLAPTPPSRVTRHRVTGPRIQWSMGVSVTVTVTVTITVTVTVSVTVTITATVTGTVNLKKARCDILPVTLSQVASPPNPATPNPTPTPEMARYLLRPLVQTCDFLLFERAIAGSGSDTAIHVLLHPHITRFPVPPR